MDHCKCKSETIVLTFFFEAHSKMDHLWRKAYFYLNKLYNLLSKRCIQIYHAFFLDLDTIVDCDSLQDIPLEPPSNGNLTVIGQIKRNAPYLFAALAYTITIVNSFMIMADAHFQYTFEGTRELVSRKISPKELWFQSDCVHITGYLIAWLVYWLLTLKPAIDPKFRVYAIGGPGGVVNIYSNGKFWSQDCAKQIVHFRKRARTLFSYAYPSGVLMATLYWTWNACHNYNGTWRDVIIISYIPVLSIMGNHGIGCIVFFITLSVRYLQIRQAALHSQLESFTAGLSKPSKRSNVLIWQRYCALNQDILRFNVELRAYSAYWSPYLSAIFGGYIALVSQLLYGALFQAHNMHFLYRSFFIFFAIEFMTLLLVVTRECAIIVRNNIRIFKTNRAFCYAFTKGSGQPNARCRLQMSKAISNYRGAKNGFRLINNFLIDSKMYEIILFYMCSIYIVLINQEKAK